jgi:hypothetical protein
VTRNETDRDAVVIRQYSSVAKSTKGNREKVSLRIGLRLCPHHRPCGFGFHLANLPTHLRDLLFQSFSGHKERTEQVPTQREKVCNRLE